MFSFHQSVDNVIAPFTYHPVLFHGSDGEKEILNKRAGHLLRTKGHGTNEGGVAAGFAVIDSPLLL